jgi:hypothetical protein
MRPYREEGVQAIVDAMQAGTRRRQILAALAQPGALVTLPRARQCDRRVVLIRSRKLASGSITNDAQPWTARRVRVSARTSSLLGMRRCSGCRRAGPGPAVVPSGRVAAGVHRRGRA